MIVDRATITRNVVTKVVYYWFEQRVYRLTSDHDAFLQFPTLLRLQAKLSTVQSELARLRNEVGARHPRHASLVQSQTTLQEQSRDEIKASRRNFAAKVEPLRHQLQQLEIAYAA